MKEIQSPESDYSLWNEQAFDISEQELKEEFESFRYRIRRKRSGRNVALAVIAILIACGGSILGITIGLKFAPEHTQQITWNEVCCRKGEQKEILLSDGTKVTLAPGSRLLYPETFNGEERCVYMNGEILFDVATNPECPFKVSVNGTNVYVTGTVFNVKAFYMDDTQVITLMEGSIDVYPESSSSSVHMTEGCAMSINTHTGDVQMYDVSASKFPAWFKGEYNAYNETLSQIAEDLERIFDVDIVFRNRNLENKVFYISIVNVTSIDDVLSALSKSGKVRISKEENLIYFN